jgi:aminopeptidase N
LSVLALAGLMTVAGCGGGEAVSEARDAHSFGRPDEVRVVHMDLDWDVSFEEKVLDGTVVLHLEHAGETPATQLHLDTRGLQVDLVESGTGGTFQETHWTFGDEVPLLGRSLAVDLVDGADQVRITYRTGPEASGLQWLEPAQTASGQHPFLYSQGQAIHTRSWIPCQDSPGVRVTFNARVTVPAALRAVMAARDLGQEGEEVDGRKTFSFTMEQPIPAYLLALAVGELAFQEVSPRTGVWAEPSLLEKSAWEFADMEKMLESAESLYGPYSWGRYDILVLPPAFPFGGMENPRLTFATPTILAGDRSLVALVAHELAHSWSGNLVTNATWSDFWLNEGFTTYITYRLLEALYGRERAEMEAKLGRQDLEEELAGDLADKPGDQILHVDLAGRDPDDGFTNVPYEKGALLLRLLEETYGRDVFDGFLKEWFQTYAFQSVTTEDFLAFLEANLTGVHRPVEGRTAPDLDVWIEQPGLPMDAPVPQSESLTIVDTARDLFLAGSPAMDLRVQGWTTHHWLHFLRNLPDDTSLAQMAQLDDAFDFSHTGNSEVLAAWIIVSLEHGYHGADQSAEAFLLGMGRRKFLKPIYQEMVKTPEGLERARDIYSRARPRYHAISQRTLDEIVP